MNHETLATEDELAFEQSLLNAGRAEPLPSDKTDAALLRFGASLATLSGASLTGVAAAGQGSAWSRVLLKSKWLAASFVAGGLTTLALVRGAPQPKPLTTVLATPVSKLDVSLPHLQSTQSAAPAAVAERVPSTPLAPRAREHVAKRSLTLADEVTALDGIRTALSMGAWTHAEQQLARYQQDFAQGALGKEAQVLRIELLEAQGRSGAARDAAVRFVAQYPRDPQIARVQALIAR